jgi:hypothetical protein
MTRAPRTKAGPLLTPPLEARSRAMRLCVVALIATVSWGTSLGASRSQSIEPAGAAAACTIARKHRVYVALAEGVELDDYERAAGAAQNIMSLVKTGLCARGRKGSRQLLTPSLRGALDAGRSVLLEEVRFDDEALEHARVLLRSSVASGSTSIDSVWRVHVHRDSAWQIDTVRDERNVRQ